MSTTENNDRQEKKPIFVVGSARSGTTIIGTALRIATDAPGYGEGHFLPLMTILIREVQLFYADKGNLMQDENIMLSHTSQKEIEEEIIAAFRDICDSLFKEEIWLEKTPDTKMIETSPCLIRAWPKARFIFAKRRGIECIKSRLKKFEGVPFETHCNIWRNSMEAWLRVKNRLKGAWIEIDQREISLNPGLVAKQIGEFLDFSQEQTNKVERAFAEERPQYTGGVEAEKAIDISETGWSDRQIELFRKYCSAVSEKFGYSESSSYYL